MLEQQMTQGLEDNKIIRISSHIVDMSEQTMPKKDVFKYMWSKLHNGDENVGHRIYLVMSRQCITNVMWLQIAS